MGISSSLKNILKVTTDAGKKVAGSIDAKDIAKTFGEDGFTSAVKKTTQPLVDSTIDGVRNISGSVSSEIGNSAIGKKVNGTINSVNNSVPGKIVKGATSKTTGAVRDFYKANVYDDVAYKKAMDDFKANPKNGKRPKQSDFKTGRFIEKDPDKFTGYRLNSLTTGSAIGLGVGTFAVAGSVGVGTTLFKENERMKYGEIYGDVSVGTINATYSPTHDKFMNSVVSNENTEEADTMGRSLSRSLANVNPEIVFAMHQLRNGGN